MQKLVVGWLELNQAGVRKTPTDVGSYSVGGIHAGNRLHPLVGMRRQQLLVERAGLRPFAGAVKYLGGPQGCPDGVKSQRVVIHIAQKRSGCPDRVAPVKIGDGQLLVGCRGGLGEGIETDDLPEAIDLPGFSGGAELGGCFRFGFLEDLSGFRDRFPQGADFRADKFFRRYLKETIYPVNGLVFRYAGQAGFVRCGALDIEAERIVEGRPGLL